MALGYTSDELLTLIRNTGMLPDAAVAGTNDTDLLSHANAALRAKVLPEVMKYREEYFVVTTRTTLGTSEKIRIPTRAAGNRLRDLFYVDGASKRQTLRQVQREKLDEERTTASEPEGYYLEGNYIVLVPPPNSTGSLEHSFFFAPSDLVLTSSAKQVTAVNASTKTVTLASAVPSGWDTADTFDVHSQNSGAEIRVWDAAATTVSGTSITFSAAIDGTTLGTNAIAVGDWVCLAGECVVPPLPRETHPILARATALRVAEAVGDPVKTQLHAAMLGEDLKALSYLVNSRVEGRPIVIQGGDGLLWAGRSVW